MYRIVTENDAEERRTIEYQSRRAAFNFFGGVAHSRHIVSATLSKSETVAADRIYPERLVWRELAAMNLNHAAAAEVEAPANG